MPGGVSVSTDQSYFYPESFVLQLVQGSTDVRTMANDEKQPTPLKPYSRLPTNSAEHIPLPNVTPPRSQRRRHAVLLGLLAFITLALFARHGCTPHSDAPAHPYYARPDVPLSASLSGPRNPAYLVEATRGAVATENGVCSQTGVDVLKDGGNAVDAAVASTLCIGVTNMFSCVLHTPPAVRSSLTTQPQLGYRRRRLHDCACALVRRWRIRGLECRLP